MSTRDDKIMYGMYGVSSIALLVAISAIVLQFTTSTDSVNLSDGTVDITVKSATIGETDTVSYTLPSTRAETVQQFLGSGAEGQTAWSYALPTTAENDIVVNDITVTGLVKVNASGDSYILPTTLPTVGDMLRAGPASDPSTTVWGPPSYVSSTVEAGAITSTIISVFDTSNADGLLITNAGVLLTTVGTVNTLTAVNSGGVAGSILVKGGGDLVTAGGAVTLSGGSSSGAAGGSVTIEGGAGSTTRGTVNVLANTVHIANEALSTGVNVNILSGAGTLATTSTLRLANNPTVGSIDIGNVAALGPRVTTISGGNAAFDDSIVIMGGAHSANTQTVSVFDGIATGGTQTLNLMTGTGGAKTVNIGTGAVANTITIGNVTGATSINLQTGTAGISITTAQPLTGSVMTCSNTIATVNNFITNATPESAISSTIGGIATDTVNGNMYIKTSGTGSTGWNLMNSRAPVIQTFLTGGVDYEPTEGMVYCIIDVIGGGGSGGTAVIAGASAMSAGAGGGAGGYTRVLATRADIGASKPVVVGTGGVGDTTNGNDGTASSVGGTLAVGGGGLQGGAEVANTRVTTLGGDGGTASFSAPVTSLMSVQGQPGGDMASFFDTGLFYTSGGIGGSSHFGAGGRLQAGCGSTSLTTGSNPGTGRGSGGSGISIGNSAAEAGGNGTAGVVIVTEFF